MQPFVSDPDFKLFLGDVGEVLAGLPSASVDAVVTSPPYLDARPEYGTLDVVEWRAFFRELRRVVTGPAFFNVGRVWRDGVESDWHFHLRRIAQREGWLKLDERIWVKKNANPIHGKFFANKHEYVLVLGDRATAINEDAGRTPYAASSVPRMRRGWTNHAGVKNDVGRKVGRRPSEPHPLGARPSSYVLIDTGREKGNPHPAPMALDLALDMVGLASWPGQTVLDPFAGSGTTAIAARMLGRKSVGIELSADYCRLAADRLSQLSLLAEEGAA